MKSLLLLTLLLLLLLPPAPGQQQDEEEDHDLLLMPTVMVVLLVRNKAGVLPFTLTLLEKQEYPKDRVRKIGKKAILSHMKN